MHTPLLGILGGMGPLATMDLCEKVIEEAQAPRDADQVPMVIYCVPQIPSRTKAITDDGPSPLPAMKTGVRTLVQAGATTIAIACNTAHHWHDELSSEAGVPVLHIADATCDLLVGGSGTPRTVGLIATSGTLAAGFFQQRMAGRGLRCLTNTPAEQADYVEPAIVAVKRHDLPAGHVLAVAACEALVKRGAECVVLACTEIPPAIAHRSNPVAAVSMDPTRALARACANWWREARRP